MKSKTDAGYYQLVARTNDGDFTAIYSPQGLISLSFPDSSKPPTEGHPTEVPLSIQAWHEVTTRALEHVLAGRKPEQLPPLDLHSGTQFQIEVWQALCRLGPGQTASYSAIARSLGRPKAARAVGAACGANPIPVLVPCHRVLAVNQRLGGFSGGLGWKKTLLTREGVAVRESRSA
jgi:O-6-methylguanine DNA methyltransferase